MVTMYVHQSITHLSLILNSNLILDDLNIFKWVIRTVVPACSPRCNINLFALRFQNCTLIKDVKKKKTPSKIPSRTAVVKSASFVSTLSMSVVFLLHI